MDISREEKAAALQAVLSSQAMSSARLSSLLEYIVAEELAGRKDQIKAYSIAVDVLGRSQDFDPQNNNVVRVEMGRLRKALTKFYEQEGQNEQIRIVIPTGSYVPIYAHAAPEPSHEGSHFFRRFRPEIMAAAFVFFVLSVAGLIYLTTSSNPERAPAENAQVAKINSVAVLPVPPHSDGEDQAKFAQSFTLDLVRILQNGNFLSVVQTSETVDRRVDSLRDFAKRTGVRFILRGDFHREGGGDAATPNQMTLALIDGKSGVVLWSEKYASPGTFEAEDYKAFLRNISFDLNPAYYAAAKKVLNEEGPDSSSSVELFLISNWVPGTAVSSLEWEKERVDLAKKALEVNPDYGPAHAVLADKLAYLATVDPPSDTQARISQSIEHAAKALAYADQKADSLYNIISHKLHLGEIPEAARLAQRTAQLDPKNVLASFYTKSMIFTCQAATDEQLREFVDFHNSLNPRNPARWITAHTVGRIELNRKNYAEAVKWGRESEKIFQSLGAAFQLSAALVQMGDVEAARSIIRKHQNNWPNLDADHFANVVIPRRCGRYETLEHLRRVYQDLARALKP